MGTTKLYLYPDGTSGSLWKIDTGTCAEQCRQRLIRTGSESQSGNGDLYFSRLSGRLSVRVRIQLGEDEATARQIMSAESFMKTGEPFAFAVDSDKTFFGFTAGAPPQNAGKVDIETRPFTSLESDLMPDAGDFVEIFSGNPEMNREWHKVDTISGTRINLVTPIRATFNQQPVMVRDRYFFPALVLPRSQWGTELVTNERGINWVFEATLIEDIRALEGALSINVAVEADDSGETIQGGRIYSGQRSEIDFGGI